MKRSMRAALGLCTTTAVLATTLEMPISSGAAGAVAVSRKALTDLEIATMAPAAQAALLDPLRATAGALSEVGGGAAADVFTSVEIDANHGVVNLYLTDTTRAPGAIQTAKSANPSIDTTLVRVHQAAYTRAAMDGARDAYLAQPHPYAVYAVSAAPDGSGLQMEVDDTATAMTAEGNGVGLKTLVKAKTTMVSPASGASTVVRFFTKGSPRQTKSDAWNNVTWHDSSPGARSAYRGHSTPCGIKGRTPGVRQEDGKKFACESAEPLACH